jgi:hypothetical protein
MCADGSVIDRSDNAAAVVSLMTAFSDRLHSQLSRHVPGGIRLLLLGF